MLERAGLGEGLGFRANLFGFLGLLREPDLFDADGAQNEPEAVVDAHAGQHLHHVALTHE